VTAVGHQRHYSILYANAVDQIKRGLLGDLHHIRAQWHRANLPGNDSWTPPLPCAAISESEWQTLVREARNSGAEAEEAIRDQYKLAEQLFTLKKKLAAAQAEFDKNPKKPGVLENLRLLEKQVPEKAKQLEDLSVVAENYGYEKRTNPNGRERSALEELIRWRLFDRTAAGLMAELGSHQLDASSIFINSQRPDGGKGGKIYPLSVQGYGVRSLFPADRDVDDHVHLNFEFPALGYYEDITKQEKVADPNKKIIVSYSSINGNVFGGYGECVMGTKGTLLLEREQEALLYAGDVNTKIEVKDGKDGKPAMATYETGGGAAVAQAATPKNVSRGYKEEIEHWAWCIRNPDPKNQPHCTPVVAMADAIIALTSNIAMRQGKRIEFKHSWFHMDEDATPEVDLGVDGAAGPRKTSELA
jgi:predicted dehydrogenase